MLREASLILLGLSIHKAIRFITQSLHNSNQPVAVGDRSPDDVILSETISPPATKYDVFLSFRGEDTRHTFASYLYKGLGNAGIHTFMDHELPKGENISPVLLRTIEESQISVIIFSENYASSTWCMDELVHILECKEKFERVVIPIFYNVDPSDIRKQKGSFGKGFDVLKRRFKDNQDKLQKWRNALVQSTSLSGWDSNITRPEFKFIGEIVRDILSKMNYNSSSQLERLVGIARHIENVEKLLNEVHIVGIWGMGGAGKTTLAKTIFQKLKDQFDAFSFVENVKEQLARISLDELHKKCLKELLKDEDIDIYDIKSNFVKKRLQRKKIFLILDDVDNSIIAEDLTNVCDWFGEGSKIIVTSRNKQVLKNASIFLTYHVSKLDFLDALYLFSLKAFKQHEPSEGYMESSKSIVEYCEGNPLALVVLGCFLYGRGKEEWESALEKLNEVPPKDIVDVLKLSFDGLDDKQQNVFLDLAFLMKEGVSISVDLIRQLYGSYVHIDISVLREKSLISFNNQNDHIEMHNLVRKMGLELSRQQLFSSPKTPIRLWRHEDIDYFFSCDKENDEVRCLSMDLSKIRRRITWSASNFRKMHNLIFLKIYKSNGRKPSELTICDHFDFLPEELRFLSWEDYPLPYMPLHFCAENLIVLSMPNSNIKQLWHGNQHFPNLKTISLRGSKHLTALPDLCHAPKIETMDLVGCVNLAQVYASSVLGNLQTVWMRHGGPRHINIGGSVKGTRSGLVMAHNYLDLDTLSFNKVRMRLFVCGNIICGVGLKHVAMPLEEKIAQLGSLLPFVRKVEWLESAIAFGDDFNQQYDYDCDYDRHQNDDIIVRMTVRRRGNIGERPLMRKELIGDNQREVINEDQVATTLIAEDYCGNPSATLFAKLNKFPHNITRWSLLTQLRLKRCDMNGNAGCCIDQDSILKSLSLSHYDSCKGIKPVLGLTLSLHIPPFVPPSGLFYVPYCWHRGGPHIGKFWFNCYVGDVCSSFYPNNDFVVQFADLSSELPFCPTN